ncbi:hypothetical protein [Petrotoga sp. 9PWA.NaAc.5.4]|uniref:hypothetical protein n=1 Tax=Petrotoga sp. 9PWA.NaAc.5.4 TaxID=1434328 RepID=UPI000CC22182|nr:hypothetical protein [Petrotoga sp. 9PWA.NaAc.5.4]PNR97194.1 hypothetical protein X924_00475 [Petrotoga sp. 9PWA.NaAc.5.4]
MEEVIKGAEEFLREHPDSNFQDLESYLRNNYSKQDVDEYLQMMGDILSGMQEIMNNPMDLLFDQNGEYSEEHHCDKKE